MLKELEYNLKLRNIHVLCFAMIFLSVFISIENAYAEELEKIEVEIKYTNGDRADYNGMKLVVYQDFEKTPLLEKTLVSNPDFITVPENHRYKIEVYANGMYADVGYVQLNNNPEKLNINIPLSGGLQIGVYYKNGNPIHDATVILKSQDNIEWKKGKTNDQGETVRYWIQSTVKPENHYIADIYLGEIFLTSYYPIKLQPGIAIDQKITTNIPEVVQELIVINLYAGNKKISSNDGDYKVTLTDLFGNKVASSKVNFRGDAQFSSLKSGTYTVKITSNNELDDIFWPQSNIHVIGDVNKFNIYKNMEDFLNQEQPFLSCNCISFRLDDVQDYWLAETQIELIKLFAEKKIPLTIGIIGNVTGHDNTLTTVIKDHLVKENIEIANHSWDNQVLTNIDYKTQKKYIIDTNKKIFDVYGVTPSVFIPPQNLYDENTIKILKENNFTHLISHIKDNSQTNIDGNFFNVPATTETGRLLDKTQWVMNDKDSLKEKINQSVSQRGYAIIMIHPQEFSISKDGNYGSPNKIALSNLGLLLDDISKMSTSIVKTSKIKPSDDNTNPTNIDENEPIDSCNCVAFRLDGIQDFWLNDVQIKIMETFIENKTPLTVGIIANAFGSDKKITDFVKQNVGKSGKYLEVATKGIGLTPFTNYDKLEQKDNLKKSIDLIESITNVRSHVFIPPDNKYNSDTLDILDENKITHISASLVNEESLSLKLKGEKIYRFPQTTSTGKFNPETNVFEGLSSQQVIEQSIQGIINYGFAVVSIQPQEFSTVVNSSYTNSVNDKQIKELVKLITELKEKGYKIVPIGKINSNVVVLVPEWIKNNAGWWSTGQIDDKTFVQGIEFLVKNGIIVVDEKSQTSPSEQTIPEWIKNNAGWWSTGQIDDKTFVQGIEFLVKNGIITY